MRQLLKSFIIFLVLIFIIPLALSQFCQENDIIFKLYGVGDKNLHAGLYNASDIPGQTKYICFSHFFNDSIIPNRNYIGSVFGLSSQTNAHSSTLFPIGNKKFVPIFFDDKLICIADSIQSQQNYPDFKIVVYLSNISNGHFSLSLSPFYHYALYCKYSYPPTPQQKIPFIKSVCWKYSDSAGCIGNNDQVIPGIPLILTLEGENLTALETAISFEIYNSSNSKINILPGIIVSDKYAEVNWTPSCSLRGKHYFKAILTNPNRNQELTSTNIDFSINQTVMVIARISSPEDKTYFFSSFPYTILFNGADSYAIIDSDKDVCNGYQRINYSNSPNNFTFDWFLNDANITSNLPQFQHNYSMRGNYLSFLKVNFTYNGVVYSSLPDEVLFTIEDNCLNNGQIYNFGGIDYSTTLESIDNPFNCTIHKDSQGAICCPLGYYCSDTGKCKTSTLITPLPTRCGYTDENSCKSAPVISKGHYLFGGHNILSSLNSFTNSITGATITGRQVSEEENKEILNILSENLASLGFTPSNTSPVIETISELELQGYSTNEAVEIINNQAPSIITQHAGISYSTQPSLNIITLSPYPDSYSVTDPQNYKESILSSCYCEWKNNKCVEVCTNKYGECTYTPQEEAECINNQIITVLKAKWEPNPLFSNITPSDLCCTDKLEYGVCGVAIGLPGFTWYNLIISMIAISLIYFLFRKKLVK